MFYCFYMQLWIHKTQLKQEITCHYPFSWKVRVRQKYLNILQTFYCRFDDDILFWKEFLSEPRFVIENKKGLSFRLVTPEDIALFESCVRSEFKFLSKAREFSTSLKEK